MTFKEMGLPAGAVIMRTVYVAGVNALVVQARTDQGIRLYWRHARDRTIYKDVMSRTRSSALSFLAQPKGGGLYILSVTSRKKSIDGSQGEGFDFEGLYSVELRRNAVPRLLVSRASLNGGLPLAIMGATARPPLIYCSVVRYTPNARTVAGCNTHVEAFNVTTKKFSRVCTLPARFI
jgi:hypothetical protein